MLPAAVISEDVAPLVAASAHVISPAPHSNSQGPRHV